MDHQNEECGINKLYGNCAICSLKEGRGRRRIRRNWKMGINVHIKAGKLSWRQYCSVCCCVYALLTTTQNGNRNVNKWSGGASAEPTTPFPLCVCEHEIFLGMRCFVFPVLTWERGDSLFKWRISIGSSWIDLLAFFKCVLLDPRPGVLTFNLKRGICIETCPLRESLL